MINRQRMGITSMRWNGGVFIPTMFEDGMLFSPWKPTASPHHRNTLRMFDTCNWWKNSFLEPSNLIVDCWHFAQPTECRFLALACWSETSAATPGRKSISTPTAHPITCCPPPRITARATAATSSTSGRPPLDRMRSASPRTQPSSKASLPTIGLVRAAATSRPIKNVMIAIYNISRPGSVRAHPPFLHPRLAATRQIR